MPNVPEMLLNEFLREYQRVAEVEKRIAKLEAIHRITFIVINKNAAIKPNALRFS